MKQVNNKYYVYSKSILSFYIVALVFIPVLIERDNKNFFINYYNDNSFASYSIGSHYSCYINSNYKMKCFGWNLFKQLGLGDSTDNKGNNQNDMGANLAYVNPGTIDDVKFKSVYCGMAHTCSILTNDKAKCWGWNIYGQLGLGSSNTGRIGNTGDTLPYIDFGSNIIPIVVAVGGTHTCTLFDNKKVKCFGFNEFGELGYENQNKIGSVPSQMGDNLPFVNLGTNILVSSIYTFGGAQHNCVIIDGSQLMKCWGRNNKYQLGYNHKINRGDAIGTMGDKLPTLNLGSVSKVLQANVGAFHTCAIRIDKELRCWGNNENGRLGLGTSATTIPTSSPLFIAVKVDSDKTKKVKYVSTGEDHTCVLLDDEISAKCVGSNDNGELGKGDHETRGNSPTNTMDKFSAINLGAETLKIKTIHAGFEYTCVVYEDSTVKCFGSGLNGRLGSGSTLDIGTSPSHMGSNLPFVNIFETLAPTKNPIKNPTNSPTKSPFIGCKYTNKVRCNKDNKCMWRSIGNGGECVPIDCSAFNKKICKLHEKVCIWKNNTCIRSE